MCALVFVSVPLYLCLALCRHTTLVIVVVVSVPCQAEARPCSGWLSLCQTETNGDVNAQTSNQNSRFVVVASLSVLTLSVFVLVVVSTEIVRKQARE